MLYFAGGSRPPCFESWGGGGGVVAPPAPPAPPPLSDPDVKGHLMNGDQHKLGNRYAKEWYLFRDRGEVRVEEMRVAGLPTLEDQ